MVQNGPRGGGAIMKGDVVMNNSGSKRGGNPGELTEKFSLGELGVSEQLVLWGET